MVNHIASHMAAREDLIPDVRKLLGQGKTQQEIAAELGVSRSTIQRIMPLIRNERDDFEPMTFIPVIHMSDEGSPNVQLPLRSFMAMVDKSLPILYPHTFNGSGEFKQYQQNVILRWNCDSQYRKFMSNDVQRWYNYMEANDLENDHFIRQYVQTVQHYATSGIHQAIRNHLAENQLSWFSRTIDQLGFGRVNTHTVVQYYIEKRADHLPEVEKDIFQRLVACHYDPDQDLFFDMLRYKVDSSLLNIDEFFLHSMKDVPREILLNVCDVPEDLVDSMIELKRYDVAELKLILKGGFETEEDIEFAKAGDFLNMKEVKKARKLDCKTKKEMTQVLDNGWADGLIMRKAVRRGIKAEEHKLYVQTFVENEHIPWTKDEIKWARGNTATTLKRLSEFSSIRALEFCDFLVDVQEPVYRTDRLMEEYNNLSSPGRSITDEGKFEEFLEEFPDFVEITSGGLTKILVNSNKSLKIDPRVNPVDFPSLKRLTTALGKSLKKALKANNLNDATTDAYSFMKYQLTKHVGPGDEDLHVIDEVVSLLNLDKKEINALHQARLARNWISHKESEQKVAPKWKFVELMLITGQKLSELKKE
jgi:predicted XRE-type DNA-binding protein